MILKKMTFAFLIAGSSISVAHALEAAPAETAAGKQSMSASNDKPAQTAAVTKMVSPGKSREQVIAELLQAKKDGSYVVVPEAYPESFYYRASR